MSNTAERAGNQTEPAAVVVDDALAGDPLIGTWLNKIEIVRRLDAGGMGTIYLGLNRELDKQYAIKVATHDDEPAFEGRSLQEAKALSKLDHPNIVQVFDAWTLKDGRLAIVMPLLSGHSLQRHIEEQPDGSSRRLSLKEALLLALQLASGLEEAHRHGLVHRDLKPGNVFVTEREVELGQFKIREVKILDFGLVRTSRSQRQPVQLVGGPASEGPQVTIAVGTPEYVSPEQAAGSPLVDGRADLYSLGVLLFQLLAGRLPFTAPQGMSRDEQVVELLRQHRLEPAPRPSVWAGALPVQLEQLIAQLLEKSPARRPPAATVVLSRLREVLDALPRDLAPPAPAPGRPKGARVARWAVLLGLGIGAAVWLVRSQQVPAPGPIERPAWDVPPPPSTPVVAVAIPVVAPPAVPPPLPSDNEEEPVALVPGAPLVRRPPPKAGGVKRTPRPHATQPPCTPDERWSKNMRGNLKELGQIAREDPTRYSKFKSGEERIMSLVQSAKSPLDCARANGLFEDLRETVSSR